jgi:hypothetical protein
MSVRKAASLVSSALFVALLFLLPRPAAAASAARAGCQAPADWFTGIPAVPTFEPRSTCQFQQWAWQAFLALLATDRAQPKPLYLTWPFPKDVLSSLYCDRQCGGSHAKPLQAQCSAPTQEAVNGSTQPGFVPAGTSGELIDQTGQAIYFTSHVSPAWADFINAERLYDNQVLENASPQLAFQAGAFEIKTSWRFTKGMRPAEKAQYFTTTACVIPEDGSTPFSAELALVGFHITGGAPNHPELLWATFEHVRNAPDCDVTPAPGAWSFYDGKANCRSGAGSCNRPNPKPLKPGQTAPPPINVCRRFAFGGASPLVARQIAALNQDVHDHLPADSKWRFYELVGTVWGANSNPQGSPTFNLQEPTGSPLLANSTLETYKQNVSCFGCHNAQFPGELAPGAPSSPAVTETKNLFVSHVALFPLFFAEAGCAKTCTGSSATAGPGKK